MVLKQLKLLKTIPGIFSELLIFPSPFECAMYG